MLSRWAIHFEVMVVSLRSRLAMRTFRLSPRAPRPLLGTWTPLGFWGLVLGICGFAPLGLCVEILWQKRGFEILQPCETTNLQLWRRKVDRSSPSASKRGQSSFVIPSDFVIRHSSLAHLGLLW